MLYFVNVIKHRAVMSNVKASLRVVLFAEKVVVAESDDPQLWQRVLGVINGDPAAFATGARDFFSPRGEGSNEEDGDEEYPSAKSTRLPTGPIDKFAADIGASVDDVQAACDPQATDPYLILDHEAWEAFKTQLGERGPLAVAPVAAAATLLALWFKNSNGHANATQAQAQAVLKSINLRDTNAARGIRRSEWLQARAGGQIILNPAKITRAKLFAKCFCTQSWADWKA